MNPQRPGAKVSRHFDMLRLCWLLLAGVAAATLAGCTGADRNDPTYNTKQILIKDTRQ